MSKALTIAQRELGAFFVSPIAYAVSAAFLLISGYFFAIILITSRLATLEYLFGNINITLLFITPLLTMRLLADEQRTGTLEILLTAPVRDWEVVTGKFLAALGLFVVMLAFTLYYPFLLWYLGGNPDFGPIISGYLGMILLASAMLALGTLASALTENQIIAAVIAFGMLLILWLLEAVSGLAAGATSVFQALSLSAHFGDFSQGAINLEDVVYYLSMTIGALFVATRVLETRRYNA